MFDSLNRFPEELNEPSKGRITIDKTRLLIAIKGTSYIARCTNPIRWNRIRT